MLDTKFLLTDEQMLQFITKGYLVLNNELPDKLHQDVMKKIYYVLHEEGNPGNNILPRVPEMQQFFETPLVKGALTSVLGPDYYMHPHRHCHYNSPGNQTPGGGQWHKDGYWSSMRSHRPWWAIIFYYTHDITEELGPTAIMPGTQYYEKFIGDRGETLLPTGKAGTMVLVHFDMWHKATFNTSKLDRYMLKFQFVRTKAPEYPSWNHQSAQLVVPGGLPAQHLNLWKDVWDWLRGESRTVTAAGTASQADLARLGEELSSADELIRAEAADKLGLAGQAAESLAPALGQLLGGSSELAALNASYALGHMGAAGVRELARQLGDGTNQVAERAAYGLQGAGAAAIADLVELLEHPDDQRRGLSAFALGMIGKAAGDAVPALVSCLQDPSEWVRRNAVEALGMIGQPADVIVPALNRALTDSLRTETDAPQESKDMYVNQQKYIRNKVGYTAALSLLRTGRDGDPHEVVGALEQAMGSKDRYVRAYAAEALGHLRSEEAIDVLLRMIRTARWCSDTSKASTF